MSRRNRTSEPELTPRQRRAEIIARIPGTPYLTHDAGATVPPERPERCPRNAGTSGTSSRNFHLKADQETAAPPAK